MGRLTVRAPIVRLRPGAEPDRRVDTLAVEEPLEIRIGGTPYVVTMRTPGHDVDLAAGFLVSEGIITGGGDLAAAIHCGGPGTGGSGSSGPGVGGPGPVDGGNTYNVLDLTLAPGIRPPAPERARSFYTTSSCGVCGTASIDAVETTSAFDVAGDDTVIDLDVLAGLPELLRAEQTVFDRTGGLHAAGLFDANSGETLVVREDVGRHNAVDKVVGWAVRHDRLPLSGTVLQVSGRASFELVQKAAMAGIPVLAAVSAPSSLAVDLATARGLTLVGFSRGSSMNAYSRADRIDGAPVAAGRVPR